jgi:hypothetical protein
MKPLDFVIALGSNYFSSRHPKEEWPAWFEQAVVFGASPTAEKRWKFSLTIPLDGPLNVNESWETIRGHKTLVTVNPQTGSKHVVLSKAPAGVVTVFEAIIDPNMQSVEVLFETPPSAVEVLAGLYLWGESRHV